MSKKHMGTSVDDLLKEEGVFEEAQTQAIKEVVAWQLAEAMKKRKISKNKLATLLKTSRTQVDRILDRKTTLRCKVKRTGSLLTDFLVPLKMCTQVNAYGDSQSRHP